MRRILGTLTAVASLLLITACGSDDDTATAPPPIPTTAPPAAAAAPSAVSPEQQASIMSAAGIPPKPDAATQAAYVAALNKIDPDIAHGKTDKAVSRGRDTCRTMQDYPDRTKQVEVTQKRWTSPDHPEGRSVTVAGKILDATREHLCPA